MAFLSGIPFAPIITADFNTDEDGFVYFDDTFRGTGEPDYADGVRVPAGGVSGGALQVLLGNVDDDDINGMSGGWEQEFTLTEPTFVKLTFSYNLTQSADYEADEFSEVLVALDGVLQGTDGNDFVARITGNGNGGGEQSTGFVQVELDFGLLEAGGHLLTLGGFNNKKTFNDEETQILFDDVQLEGAPLPADAEILINKNFNDTTGGFVFQDDIFRGTNEPDYADGQRVETGGEQDGVLQVELGGEDNADITDMSGGWVQTFELTETAAVKLCFRFNMTQASDYEADEFSEVLVSLNNVLQGTDGNDFIAQIFGNGNGGPPQTTGWQEIELDLGILGPGTHTLALGGFNNKKTLANESTEILFDDVLLVQSSADPVKLFDDADQFVGGFATLEDAIAASSADFRIEIVETTLATGPAQIVIPHNLTIEGAGQDLTVLQASASTVNSGDDKGWFLVPEGVEFNLNGLTLDGNGFEIFQGIRTRGSGDIDDVKFLNITSQDVGGGQPYSGLGVVVFGAASDVDITNSTFENIGRVGALFFGPGVTGTFQGNTYTGKGAGDHLDYAADINAGATVQVIDNTVTNNRGVASSDGSVSAGFLVSTSEGLGTNVTFEGNTTENNSTGFFIGFDQDEESTVTFNAGNTATNSETGVQVRGNPTVNTPENVTGDSADFNYVGGDASSDFGGAAQDDRFNAGEGDDTQTGGEGSDTFVYNTGDDSSVGSEGDDVIDGGTTGAGPVDSDRDTLVIEGSLNNTIEVFISDGETFDGPGGFADDHIAVSVDGLPDTVLDVDNIEDIVIGDGTNPWDVFIAGDFSATDLAPSTITLNGGNGTDLLNADGLTSAHDIVAFGNGGDDTLNGGAGNDLLDGGAGNADRLRGNGGDDTIDGGAGDADVAVFTGLVPDYTITLLPDGSLQVADSVPNRDGTDTLTNIEALQFDDATLPVGPVLVFDGGGVFQGGFPTIQDGVNNALDGFTVLVAPGTYNENVEIGVSINLLSSGGRLETTIRGSAAPGGAETGTVYILDGTDDVQIGAAGQGFTIVGFDNPLAPGIETAAVYIDGDQNNIDIIDNEIAANGEAGLLTEWGATIDGLTVSNNTFSGQTFFTGQPVSTVQWTPNFPWALLFVGNAPTKSNIVVTDNLFEGQTAGTTIDGEIFGNIAVTVDANGATVTGNTFAADSNNFGLRTRGTNTEVSNNTFDNSVEGNTTGFTLGGEAPSGPYVGNVFIGGETGDVFFGTPGEDQTFTGGDGKDFLAGNDGDDIIDGGADIDTAVFNGPAANYNIVFGTDGTPTTIIDANFDAGADGFVFADDTFNGTNQPDYASGQQVPVGGFSGGALQVLLGNVDDADILGMSGGFEQTFNLAEEARVTLSLRFNMTQSSEYEADEFSQVLVALDGVLQGIDGDVFLAQLVGNGNGGGAQSTGFQQVELDLGILPAGPHTLTLGGFNNKKTLANEETEILFDDVLLTSTPAPTEVTVFEQDFDLGPGDFDFVPDAFRGTNAPAYVTAGVVNDELLIGLGNVDNDDILGMSGGFSREFTLDEPGEVIVTFTYNLTQSADYEADEFSQVLVALDGVLQGAGGNDFIDQVTGNGNGGGAISTGPQEITINLGELEAGNHTLTFGGFNNKKTLANEETEVTFDDIVVKQLIAPSGATTVTDIVGDDGTDTLIDVENLFFLGEDPVQVFDADGNFVNAFTTIQGAIDDAGTLDGFKIVVGPGEYNENVTVNKQLTIAGAGPVLLNGDGLGGNGITIAADNVTIDPITVTNFAGHGIYINSTVSNILLDGVRSTGNGNNGLEFHNSSDVTNIEIKGSSFDNNDNAGLRVSSTGQVDGLTVTNSHFDDNEYGWYVANDGNTSSVQNVSVSDTSFDRNFDAAIYAETMVGADFSNVTAIDSGIGPNNNIAFDFVSFYDQTEVSDITFDGFTVQNTTNDTVFSAFRFESFPSLATTPPVTDIVLLNGTVDNVEQVVRTNGAPFEFSQNNVTLTNIANFESQQRGNESSDTFNGDLFSNNDRDLLEGEASFFSGGAADTLNGGGGNDVLIGRLGDDELNGGDGLDAALFAGLGSEYSVVFGLDGLPVSVTDTNALDGNEGTDTLDSVETLFFLGEGANFVQVFDATGNFVASYETIQAAVSDGTTLDDFKVVIGSGIFDESVTVDKALQFVGVDTGGGLPVITPPAGSAFVLSGDLGAGNTVGFHNLKFEDAPRSGIQLSTGVTLGTLEITDSHFSGNEKNGVEVEDGEDLSNFVLENSTFFGHGLQSISTGDADVLLLNYQGDAILRNLLLTGVDHGASSTENGIRFRGTDGSSSDPEGPLGSVLLENIVVDGVYEFSPIVFSIYDNVDGLTMTNVQVLAETTDDDKELNFFNIADDVDLGDFDVTLANGGAFVTGSGLGEDNTFIGGDGNDILIGEDGNDILIGGAGEDSLSGGLGSDSLTGGADSDTFVILPDEGGGGASSIAAADVITDFEDGIDRFLLVGSTFEDLEISSSNGDAVIAVGAEVLAVVQNADGLLDASDFLTVFP